MGGGEGLELGFEEGGKMDLDKERKRVFLVGTKSKQTLIGRKTQEASEER